MLASAHVTYSWVFGMLLYSSKLILGVSGVDSLSFKGDIRCQFSTGCYDSLGSSCNVCDINGKQALLGLHFEYLQFYFWFPFDWQTQFTATCWYGELCASWPLTVIFAVCSSTSFSAKTQATIKKQKQSQLFVAANCFMMVRCLWALNTYNRTTDECLWIDTFNSSSSSVTDNVELCSVVKPLRHWGVACKCKHIPEGAKNVWMSAGEYSFTHTCFRDRMMWRLKSAEKRPCSFLRHNKSERP